MTPLHILTRGDDKLAQPIAEQLKRRRFTGHGEIQLVLSDRKDEQQAERRRTIRP